MALGYVYEVCRNILSIWIYCRVNCTGWNDILEQIKFIQMNLGVIEFIC